MAKRMDRIYMYVKEKTAHLTKAEYDQGVTTQEIAEVLGIQRTNSSKDLNQLVREGKLIKTDGRPVRYIYQTLVTHVKPVTKHVVSYKETPVSEEKNTLQIDTKDIFAKIIGANGSMKNSVEQAKAAILYPPRGLNCLITGPTGSGKTYFAHAMYHFAKAHHVIDEETELIVFNCADYANNPELLMSHLFGYAKGAFTGADDIFYVMIAQGLAIPAIIVLGANIWTTNNNALYTGGLAISNITNIQMKITTWIAGVIGTILSIWLYYNFTGWLNILNCALPPIGIIVILDFFMKRKKYKDNMDVGNFNSFNIVGVIVGAIVANILPWGIAAVNAMVVASVCYFIGYIRKKEA